MTGRNDTPYARLDAFLSHLPSEGDAIARYVRNGVRYSLTGADLRAVLDQLRTSPLPAAQSEERVPARMDSDTVAALLSEMALRVKAGDSFDGTVSYRAEPFAEDFDVVAVCGVGHLSGLPNVRTIEGRRD